MATCTRPCADAHPIDVQQAVTVADLAAALTAELDELPPSDSLREHIMSLRGAALTMLARLCQRAQAARPAGTDKRYASALVLAGQDAANGSAAGAGAAPVPVQLAAACLEVLRCAASCACAPVRVTPQHRNANFVAGCVQLISACAAGAPRSVPLHGHVLALVWTISCTIVDMQAVGQRACATYRAMQLCLQGCGRVRCVPADAHAAVATC